MPDRRVHRGASPTDLHDFSETELARLAEASADFSWLLTKGYARRSGIKLVGDRYELTERQRQAVLRCGCSDQDLAFRRSREVPAAGVAGDALWIDGFNLLTTVESALAGGAVLVGRDGCYRDMASMNGHFKRVLETAPAFDLIGRTLDQIAPREIVWFLDKSVSNSGRLAKFIRETAAQGRNWRVELVPNPDPVLAVTEHVVATADSGVLDAGPRWVNLAALAVRDHVPAAWLVHFARG